MEKIKKIMYIIKSLVSGLFYKNKIFLLGIPLHGNLGDHAIAIAEEKFLNDVFDNYKVINLHTNTVIKFNFIFKKLIKNSPILYTGGGFLGSLWPNEEKWFEYIVENYKKNKIIALPQTIYFTDDQQGKEILEKAKSIYCTDNLILIAREEYTYDYIIKNFDNAKVYLLPDMVLYLDKIKKEDNKDVLFCIREDKEKINYDLTKVKEYINNNKLGDIHYTDTVINRTIYPNKRKNYVLKKIKEFSQYKLVITDRLHGMIFSYLANTPCVVLENKSFKILGVYDWIKDCEYIELSDEENLIESINKVIDVDTNYVFDKNKFDELKELVNELLN